MVSALLRCVKNSLKHSIQEIERSLYVVLTLLLIIIVHLYLEIGALHSTPFISDEGFIVYATRAIFAGEVPYKRIFLNQPPIMYFYYGYFMQLLGWNLYTTRIAVIVLLTINTILIFLLARTLMQKFRNANAYAVACSAIYALYPSYYGAGVHTTGFVIEEPLLTSFYLFSTISYAKFVNHESTSYGGKWLFASGFFAGCALMTKMTGILFIAALFFFHLISRVFSKKTNLLKKEIARFITGAIVLPFFSVLFIYFTGGLANFFQHVFFKNLYQQGLGDTFSKAETLVYLRSFTPIFPVSLIGAFFLIREAYNHGRVVLLLPMWLYFSNLFSFVFLIKSTTTKYFISIFPFHYLIAVFGYFMIAVSLWRTATTKHLSLTSHPKLGFFSLMIILIIVFVLLANPLAELTNRMEKVLQYQNPLSFSPIPSEEEHTLINYDVGKYVESVTKSSDRIWTSEGAIAFFANRLIIPPLSSSYPYQAFWADQLVLVKFTDFNDAWETDKTKSLILVQGPVRIGGFTLPYPDETMWSDTSIRQYIESNYILAKTIQFQSSFYQVWLRATNSFVADPSLEEGNETPNNWKPLTWSGVASFDWNNKTFLSGHRSVEINASSETHSAWVSYPNNRVIASKYCGAKVYIKTKNVIGKAFVSLSWFDESGTWISTTSSIGVFGTTDWKLFSVSSRPPPQAAEVCVELHLQGSGEVWFDDVSLQMEIS